MRRPLRSRLHGSRRWRNIRNWFIAENPLCERCEAAGRTVPAEQVDHRVPAVVRPDLFFDTGNLSALCAPCHSVKSEEDIERYGIERMKTRPRRFLPCRPDGSIIRD